MASGEAFVVAEGSKDDIDLLASEVLLNGRKIIRAWLQVNFISRPGKIADHEFVFGMGKMQDKAVVRDGQVVVRKMLPFTLAFDHRIADGADAARFMNDLVEMLEDPVAFLMRL